MRTTLHNGRKNRQGQAYRASHNDRKFDLDKAEHINQERTKENVYWHYLQNENPDMDFTTAEKTFYEQHFSESLEARNKSYIRHGNSKQVKSMEQYMQEHCPEETIWMIGNSDEKLPVKFLQNIWKEQRAWMESEFPQMKILDFAIHVDEQGQNHLHERHVFIGHDKAGREVVGQNKALAEMGISAPNPEKPTGRHNNAKMTYTAKCREHFQEICKRHGLEIEVQPRERSEMGLTQAEYKTRREEAAADRAEVRRRAAERTAAVLQKEIAGDEFDRELANFWGDIEKNDRLQELADIQAENDRLKAENARQQAEISRLREEQHKTHESLLKLAEARSERSKELRGMNYALEDKKAEFEAIKGDMSQITKDLQELQGYLTEAQQNRAWELSERWNGDFTR